MCQSKSDKEAYKGISILLETFRESGKGLCSCTNFQLLYVHPFWLLKKEPLAHLSFGDQKMANLMNIVLRCESKVHSNILLRFNISTSRAPNSYGSGIRSRHLNVKNFSTGNCIPCSGLFTADSKSLSKSQF